MRFTSALLAALAMLGAPSAQAQLRGGMLLNASSAGVPAARSSAPLAAQAPARLIEVIDVDARESQIDITLQFNCSLHYAGHAPASEGSELRLRLRLDRDCGAVTAAAAQGGFAAEIPPVSGPHGIIDAAHLESSLGAEVTLTLTWARPESFVVAQGASATGLHIRLLRSHEERPRILVADRGDVANNFAVNLESQRQPFDAAALERAARRLQTATFVSEIEVGDEKWYRLRAGPFEQRAIAESVLRAAARDYPRAWLAVGDDSVTSDPNSVIAAPALPAVAPIGSDPDLPAAERAMLLEEARQALAARDFTAAVQRLTKLQRQAEYPQRAEVQELLGLTRERAGEVAQAKAEYEEYLRRYPHGAAAERIKERLRMLQGAAATARSGGLDAAGSADHGWKISGGASQIYRRDSYGTDLNGPLYSTIVENAVFTDADVFVHRDGERLLSSFRSDFGYAKNLLPTDIQGADDRVRITTAYLDLDDRLSGVRGRIGRQLSSGDGTFGPFDGAVVSYQFARAWSARVIAGLPVEDYGQGVRTSRHFGTAAMEFSPYLSHWDASVYFTQQQFDGMRDRRAFGTQVQYGAPRLNLVSYLDYDTAYRSLNAAVLTGSLQLPARWQLTVDAEHRNSPLLTTRNALIGQPVDSLQELEQIYNLQQIYALARERTPEITTYSVSALKQLAERFQLILDVFDTTLTATPASGGVVAYPGTAGHDRSYQLQLLGESLLRTADFQQIVLRYDTTQDYHAIGTQLISRYPLLGAWRFGPRVLIQRRQTDNGLTQYVYTPYGRLDWQRNGRLLELEAGAELGHNPPALQIGNSQRLFVSLGYRINF
ncbi:MAG: SPOR domain-containing protein [Sinobacteraceae bacterium]|nr:SPOR domain-containing protein [Nevskiaceae bacterium]